MSIRRTAIGAGAAGLLLALVAAWWSVAAGGRTPTAVPAAPSVRSSTTPAGTGSAAWGVPRPSQPDDRDTAVMVARFLERGVTLDGADRERWVRAWTRSGREAGVAGFLDQWVKGLVDRREVEPDPLNGAPTGVSLQTLGGRVLTSGSDARLTRVILWQRVTVNADPPVSSYLVSFSTVGPTDQGLRIDAVDGFQPGPAPDGSTAALYPPLEP